MPIRFCGAEPAGAPRWGYLAPMRPAYLLPVFLPLGGACAADACGETEACVVDLGWYHAFPPVDWDG